MDVSSEFSGFFHVCKSRQAEHKRERLLNHPLVLAMIRHKWGVAKSFYFLFLAFYAFFLSMVTAYMVIAQPPFNE